MQVCFCEIDHDMSRVADWCTPCQIQAMAIPNLENKVTNELALALLNHRDTGSSVDVLRELANRLSFMADQWEASVELEHETELHLS